ncbi:hypothetical protein [Clostridium thailandense]|uniref:Uncharacterized protein n=1 Tax=Clostridium thailandense TaxID=2794346 RepID=A0A949WWU4_9CLOT|nr:hypothetical protein [Clostridium thailandense]MBV7275212.1 hypothetical protein [Clostridium thailandense]MCH5136848.1 hypothetical protein [Clostridiaceae bacterium UIB06]
MSIKNKSLRTSINNVISDIKKQEWTKLKKSNISIEEKERDILNMKYLPAILRTNDYKEMELFERHLMLNLW